MIGRDVPGSGPVLVDPEYWSEQCPDPNCPYCNPAPGGAQEDDDDDE